MPYLTLLPEEIGQRSHRPREGFKGPRYIIKTGAPCHQSAGVVTLPSPKVPHEAMSTPAASALDSR